MLDYQIIVLFLALGAFVGFVAGLFGIGGGGVLVPMLAWIFLARGAPKDDVMYMALGTSMACIIITSFSSFRAHSKLGFVQWKIFKMMAPGVVIGTLLGTFLATSLSSFILAVIFSIFMLFSSLKMFFSKPQSAQNERILTPKAQFLAGSSIGAISSMVSIGGGILSVPYLNFQGLDIKKAIATSAAIGFPLSISGTIGYAINGFLQGSVYVNLIAVIFVTLTSYFFAPLGARLIHKIPSQKAKKLFALLPFLLSIKMITQLI